MQSIKPLPSPSADVLQRSLKRERSARKEAEALLEIKSRELYEKNEQLQATIAAHRETASLSLTVLENAAEGIITFDAECRIEAANPAATRIFGYDEGELIGTDVRRLMRTDLDQDGAHDPQRSSCVGVKKDGTNFEMELAGSRVELDDRQLFTWLVRDITNRRNLERQVALGQKMESVGQLAAGIAHEINTPIQYIGDNTTFLDDSFSKLDALLSTYGQLHQACVKNNWLADLCSEIANIHDEWDIDFLRDQIPQAIKESSHGTSRVAEIVGAMKEFSHPGAEKKTPTDINQSIEGTVTISRHEWKYVASVEMDLDVTLPAVPCYPGELNQALLNLIVNAAHAIREASESDADLRNNNLGVITIRTRRIDDCAEILISDTGTGMSEALQSRIFEPFFTTKGVGVGTGQGLSIVYSVIVEKHNGSIEVDSQLGKGTTFRIQLPIEEL